MSEIEVLSEFGKQFPKEYSNLEIKNMQNREGNIITNLKNLNPQDYFTIPIIENNKVIGRIFSNKGKV